MKQLLLLCLGLHFTISSGAQYADTAVAKPQTDYLEKSRKEKTTAWVLLGGGALLTTIGIAVGVGESTEAVVDVFSGEEVNESSTGAVLMVAGLAAMVGSIPFFIASGKNKRKAAALSFNIERLPRINKLNITDKQIPALTLKINL